MKVVRCEVCERKTAKLPKHMQEKWNGNVCGDCRKKIENMEAEEFLNEQGINPDEFEGLEPERKRELHRLFTKWQKGETV